MSSNKKEETSQLENIIGPTRRDDETCTHNEEKMLATWDHNTIGARMQEEGFDEGREEEVDWIETKNRRADNGTQKKWWKERRN